MAALVPPGTLKALSARSDARGLAHLAGHLAAIGLAATLVLATRDTWWLWSAAAILGVLEVALFAPLHETTHRTPFRSGWLNRTTGWLAGFVLILPPEGFRLFHLAHHRHTQDPERDPELLGAAPLTRARYLWLLTGLPYWGSQLANLARNACGDAARPWVPPASQPLVIREARVYAALYLGILASTAFTVLPLLLWVIPVLIGQPVLRWVLMAEHHGCPFTDDRLTNTRTTVAGRAFALLFWNANLHAEHHLAPGLPFHALPKLHALVRPRLAALSPSYTAAHGEIRRAAG